MSFPQIWIIWPQMGKMFRIIRKYRCPQRVGHIFCLMQISCKSKQEMLIAPEQCVARKAALCGKEGCLHCTALHQNSVWQGRLPAGTWWTSRSPTVRRWSSPPTTSSPFTLTGHFSFHFTLISYKHSWGSQIVVAFMWKSDSGGSFRPDEYIPPYIAQPSSI
jgi:hypothetical protein